MNVSLTPELERFVRDRVSTGLYNNSSEVVREALRLLRERAASSPGAQSAAPKVADVLRILRGMAPSLKARGINSLSIFGSVVRNEAKPDSDIDLLIEFVANHKPTLMELSGLQAELSQALGHKADIIAKTNLRKELRRSVLKEAERIF